MVLKRIIQPCLWVLLFVVIPVSGAIANEPAAPKQENSATDTEDQSATQRLDFGIYFYNSEDGRVTRGGLNYNWVPLPNHSFAATLPVVNSSLASVDGSGIGDLLLRYNWSRPRR